MKRQWRLCEETETTEQMHLSFLHSGRAQERAIQLKHVLHIAGLESMAAAFNAQPWLRQYQLVDHETSPI